MELKEIVKKSESFRYQLLDRLKGDCKYYLGNGGRNNKHLWAGDEKKHIEAMKEIWKSFAEGEKPEWLTWEDILEYENKLKG